jgi:hypothetical protein
MDMFAGVTAMELSVALVTVRVAEFEVIVPDVAVIVVVPAAKPLAIPCGTVLLIVAKLVLDEFQVTLAVRFFMLPSA